MGGEDDETDGAIDEEEDACPGRQLEAAVGRATPNKMEARMGRECIVLCPVSQTCEGKWKEKKMEGRKKERNKSIAMPIRRSEKGQRNRKRYMKKQQQTQQPQNV